MTLTAQQQAEIERQRREDPERRHFMIDPTPEQVAYWKRAVAEEMVHKEEDIREGRSLLKPFREDSFSGELRRAMVGAKQNLFALGERIAIDRRSMADFLVGEASLPSDAIDRLIHELKLNVEVRAAQTEQAAP